MIWQVLIDAHWKMGKGNRFKKARGGAPREESDTRKPYEAWEYKTNSNFDTYYRAQRIVPEEDFDKFIAKLLEPLPVTFRVNQMMPSAPAIEAKLDAMASTPFLLSDGATIEPPRRLPWYPGGTAWHVGSAKSEFRKHEAFKAFNKWLIAETDAGCLSRCDWHAALWLF